VGTEKSGVPMKTTRSFGIWGLIGDAGGARFAYKRRNDIAGVPRRMMRCDML